MSPRSILLSTLAAGSLVATPIALSITNTAHADSESHGRTVCIERSKGECNSHKGKNGENKSSDDNAKGQLRISKTWLDGTKQLKSGPFEPVYTVTCADDEFTGNREFLEAQKYPAGVCSVAEVAVPDNGWLEDASTKQVTFAGGDDESDEKLTSNDKDDDKKEDKKSDKKEDKKDEAPTPSTVSFVNKRLGFSATASAEGTTTKTWAWTLDKVVDRPNLNVAVGSTETVTYTVTPKATATTTSAIHGKVIVSDVPSWTAKSVSVSVNDLKLDCETVTSTDDETEHDELDDNENPKTESDTVTLECAFDIANAPESITATITFETINDSETIVAPIKVATGKTVEINRYATLTDAYDGADPIVLNPAVDATNPRVESYTKTYTNTVGTVDDSDQKLIPGEVEIDRNEAALSMNPPKTDDTKTDTKTDTDEDNEEDNDRFVASRGFVAAIAPAKIVAAATVTATGLQPQGATKAAPAVTIAPTVLGTATTTAAPTTGPTPTTAPAAAPAVVLASDLLQIQEIPSSTIPTSVLGESITSAPAFTGSSSSTMALLGAAAIALGGVFTALSAARRSKRA